MLRFAPRGLRTSPGTYFVPSSSLSSECSRFQSRYLYRQLCCDQVSLRAFDRWKAPYRNVNVGKLLLRQHPARLRTASATLPFENDVDHLLACEIVRMLSLISLDLVAEHGFAFF